MELEQNRTAAPISVFKNEWEQAYENKNNFVFSPNEEVIRFISRVCRKRVGLDEFVTKDQVPTTPRFLDLGCGIGRHVMFAHEMGFDPYGLDLSEHAIQTGQEWAKREGLSDPKSHLIAGDARKLPWEDSSFDLAISCSTLDSMPFAVAQQAVKEVHRVLKPGAPFWCDVISGDDSEHAREFSGDEIVATAHEHGTVQSYYNFAQIQQLVGGLFEIESCLLIQRTNVLSGDYRSRYSIGLKKRVR